MPYSKYTYLAQKHSKLRPEDRIYRFYRFTTVNIPLQTFINRFITLLLLRGNQYYMQAIFEFVYTQ